MADKIRVQKLVAMLSAPSGEAANAAAMLSKIAAAEKLTVGELLERTYSGKQFQFDQQGLDDIAEQVRASHAEAEKWRRSAATWQAQAQAQAQRAPQQATPAHAGLNCPDVWGYCWRAGFVLVCVAVLAGQLR